ncbi:MAG: DMT family transporter [Clostridiales bacterium]|jgi:drug/metabolite transporter (DMT)-like permease|nr:DMT family transporter [Clostridiales bacterium]
MKRVNLKGNLLILLATFIWGTAFAAQDIAMDNLKPLTFNAARFLIGGCVTMIPALILNKRNEKHINKQSNIKPPFKNTILFAGLVCGAVLFVSSLLQQIGIQYTTVGKGGFITSLYVVIVPVAGLFFKRKPHIRVWIGVAAAVAGMYLMCIGGGFAVNAGDMYILACAFCFAGHILVVDHFAPRFSGIMLSSIQFFVVGFCSCIGALIFETPSFGGILAAAGPILYSGCLSCGIAYTLQIFAQKSTDPAIAGMLFATESIFALITGVLILGERFSLRELFGCALVMAALLVAQIPGKNEDKAV